MFLKLIVHHYGILSFEFPVLVSYTEASGFIYLKRYQPPADLAVLARGRLERRVRFFDIVSFYRFPRLPQYCL